MNITLLNPRLKTWSPTVYVPVGLAYVAAALEQAGHCVAIADLNSHQISDKHLAKRLVGAEIIGITGMITEYAEVIRLAGLSKRVNPTAKVIIGGPLATTYTHEVLENSQADFVVVGEGEKTVVKLVEAIQQGCGITDMGGVAYKVDGSVRVAPPAKQIRDLDTIPYPARHLLDMSHYTQDHFRKFGITSFKVKSATMFSSRGCPYHCTFCFQDVWGNKWRGRSPNNIIGEMLQLNRQYGFNAFVFNDDTFVLNKQRVFDFCKKMIDIGLGFKWYCNGRVNLMTKEMLGTMAEAGCAGIGYGLESGNQQVLTSLGKGITLEQVEKVTRWTMDAGINVTGYFIIGSLGETRATITDTIHFARKLGLNFYAFAMLAPIIGTPMYQAAQEQGLLRDLRLEDWNFYASANLTKDCTRKDLESFNVQAFKEFTIRKRYGRYYLLNPMLWIDGFESLLFLAGKRDLRQLLRKAWGIVKKT